MHRALIRTKSEQKKDHCPKRLTARTRYCGRWRGVLIGEGTGESDGYRQADEGYDDDVMAPVSGGAHSWL